MLYYQGDQYRFPIHRYETVNSGDFKSIKYMVVVQFMPMHLSRVTLNFLEDLYIMIENMFTTSYIII